MRKVAYIFTILLMYFVACAPLIYLHQYCPKLLQNVRVCMITDYVFGITVACFLVTLFALVLKAYGIAFLFALLPLFIELILLTSSLLVFMFHKELTAAMIRGKIRAVGSGVFSILKAPFIIFTGGK
ncbi:TPA: hypothetical protein DIC20_05700 [Candidatus Dependentiae bacterium]|nr:MAG: hypothetical protein US03_C0010G0063 [candidate division TM6 bacterium GW2011_GWF2_36_131]KKQ02752.1 MAG: hypothetical protein US13_C0010G0012 [candidate division TM6 bacterium GW2011_GWE2_36_25]KKQ19151.1 MAG: hypothetical protein US32_C0015G0034 [candidate division TM6 bacterium GW2011_GWA2_36_9]HBR70404.1 hypothetical protein [Candidatus Dependentiae bacterium]HCU01159.1 hypothetical protein [Candidatus Dependentiae bacterium]